MTRPDWRLVNVWEGDPVGVDPKRPLVGFALVAMLCAVLMFLSVGRGYSFDFIQPGKPIASAVGGHVKRAPAPQASKPAQPVETAFPVELSTPLLPVPSKAPATTVTTKVKSGTSSVGTIATSDDETAVADDVSDETSVEAAADTTADDRDAAKADRKADRDAAKA